MVRQGIKITYQMKYLRKFNESVTPKKLYTTEDIEDFFYSFIDDKYLKFEKTEETSDRHVSTIFKFTEKFNRIKSSESMQNYIQLLTEIEKKCRQWNLIFELNIGSFPPIFIIKQPIPVILPGIYDTFGNYATTGIEIFDLSFIFRV